MPKVYFVILLILTQSLHSADLKKELLNVKDYYSALGLCKKFIADQPDTMETRDTAYDAFIAWWHLNGKYLGYVKPDVRELDKFRTAENSIIKEDTLESHLEKFIPFVTSLRAEIEPQLPRGVLFGAVASEIISREIIRKNLELSLKYNTYLE